MLDLRRLRLLRELDERGTIAAVADALQFTPSAVSQQLALLEREAGVPLLERAGRGVRLTDAALVLVGHADALLERAALAEADLAAAAGTVTGRARIGGFQSVMRHLALPAMEALARDAPRLRCELVEAEPEDALPSLALGDLDLVLADEWQHQPRPLPAGVERHELLDDPVNACAEGHPALRRTRRVPLAELHDQPWVTGHPGMGWEQMTQRTCRELGDFEPDIRHRTNDATSPRARRPRPRARAAARPAAARRPRARRLPRHRGGAGEPHDLRRDAGGGRLAPVDARAPRRDPRRRTAAVKREIR